MGFAMSSARDNIFRSIARAKNAVIDNKPTHIIPAKGQFTEDDLLEVFCAKVKASSATLATISSEAEVPEATAAYLNGLDPAIYNTNDTVYVNHPELAALNWQAQRIVSSAQSEAFNCRISVAKSPLGIAETGSVILQSGPQLSSAAYFLPDILIVVIHKNTILANQEAAWQSLRSVGGLPRTVTIVTGPSRTGDIEQKLVIGAHGPRHEHLLIIDNT